MITTPIFNGNSYLKYIFNDHGDVECTLYLDENLEAGYHWGIQSNVPLEVIITYEHVAPDEDEEIYLKGKAKFVFEYNFKKIAPQKLKMIYTDSEGPVAYYPISLIGSKMTFVQKFLNAIKGK